jgi:hypothetical protein
MKESGLEDSEMDRELRFGLTELNILDSGKITERMARAHLYMSMGMSMKETGSMTKLMGMASTYM